jgi:DNA-binding MarR family transcriptional regulator
MSPARLNKLLSTARQAKLGATALQALTYLVMQQGRSTLTDITRHLGFTSAAATGLADSLEKQGHVTREREPEDRRTIYLRITDKGSAIIKQITGHPDATFTPPSTTSIPSTTSTLP